MTDKKANIILSFLFVIFVILGAYQGRNVEFYRECEAFYRWILAVGTQERLFQASEGEQKTGKFVDLQLFDKVSEKAIPLLQNEEMIRDSIDNTLSYSENFANIIGDISNDPIIWKITTKKEMEELRKEFLKNLRGGKIEFSRNITYAEAQESGVNIFNLFFGFRKIAASLIWLEVDRYWHQGLLYRMVPLMRTCVTLDPNFVEAYLIGAWHLAYNATAKLIDTPQHLKKWNPKYKACVGEKETFYYLGIDFLKKGIRHNPRDYKLYFDLGFAIYKNKMNDYPNAVRYLTEAVRVPHERWVRRQLYICQELNGQYEEALQGWEDYKNRFPDNPIAPRFILRNQGKIYEKKAQELIKEVEKISDEQIKEEKIKEAENLKKQAKEIWEKLSKEESDPYGDYRLLLMDAMDLYNQGRFLESIAVLDKARWESPSNFDEASDLIIKIKQEANLPLTVSEKKAVLRKAEGDRCQGMPEEIPSSG